MKRGKLLLFVPLFLLGILGCSGAADQGADVPGEAPTTGVFQFTKDSKNLVRFALSVGNYPDARSGQEAQSNSNYFEVWGKRYNAAVNFYEVYLLYPNPAIDNSGMDPGDAANDIEVALEPGLWDLLLLAGYKDAAYCDALSGKPLLLGVGCKERQQVLAGKNDIDIKIEAIEVSTDVPTGVQTGTAFTVDYTVDFKNPGFSSNTNFLSLAPDSRITVVSTENPPAFSALSLEQRIAHPSPVQTGGTFTETWRFRAPTVPGNAKLRIDYWAVDIFGSDLGDSFEHQWAIADFANPNPALGSRYAQTFAFTAGAPPWFGTKCYVDQYGDDATGTGDRYHPFATPIKALAAIKTAYHSGTGLPAQNDTPVPVTIFISGTIVPPYIAFANAVFDVSEENAYPPIIVKGKSAQEPGVLNASTGILNGFRVTLNNQVTMGENLTLHGAWNGVILESGGLFCLQGGIIDSSTFDAIKSTSADVIIRSGQIRKHSTSIRMTGGAFAMSGGTISDSLIGISINGGSGFVMNGGSISADSRAIGITGVDTVAIGESILTGSYAALDVSGAATVTVSDCTLNGSSYGITANNVGLFTLDGGIITSGSTGIDLSGGTTLEMRAGSIVARTFGVFADTNCTFTMTGGSILPPVTYGVYKAGGAVLDICTIPPITSSHHYGGIPDAAHRWP